MTRTPRHCEEATPDVATLRLSREQNQARLNYAEAKQGRPKVNLQLSAVDPHVATLLGMTVVFKRRKRQKRQKGGCYRQRCSSYPLCPFCLLKSLLSLYLLIYSYILRIWSFIGCGHSLVVPHISLLILILLTATICSSRL